MLCLMLVSMLYFRWLVFFFRGQAINQMGVVVDMGRRDDGDGGGAWLGRVCAYRALSSPRRFFCLTGHGSLLLL